MNHALTPTGTASTDRKLRDYLGTYLAGALLAIGAYWVRTVDARRADDRADWQAAIREIVAEQKRFNEIVSSSVPRHASAEARLNGLENWKTTTDAAMQTIQASVDDRLEKLQVSINSLGREVSGIRASMDMLLQRTDGKP